MARWRAFRGQENICVTPHREDRSIATRLKVENSACFSRKQLSVVHIRYQSDPSYHAPHTFSFSVRRQQQYTVCSHLTVTPHITRTRAIYTRAIPHIHTAAHARRRRDTISRLRECSTQLAFSTSSSPDHAPDSHVVAAARSPPPTTSPHAVTRTRRPPGPRCTDAEWKTCLRCWVGVVAIALEGSAMAQRQHTLNATVCH